MRKLNFKVKPAKGTRVYAIWVDGKGVELLNRKGSIKVNPGEKHILHYFLSGNPGGTLNVVGKDVREKTIVEVKEAKIPSGQTRHGDKRKFDF